MPTVLTHPVPALALAAALGTRLLPPRLAAAALICAVLPDLDVLGFRFGVLYADALGHRGLSHSLLLASAAGGLGLLLAPWLKSGRIMAFLAIFLAMVSHAVLDAMTSGGLGVAFFWPFDEARHFLPWRPIVVSPFSLRALLSQRGIAVLSSEFLYVWLPCLFFALIGVFLRQRRR